MRSKRESSEWDVSVAFKAAALSAGFGLVNFVGLAWLVTAVGQAIESLRRQQIDLQAGSIRRPGFKAVALKHLDLVLNSFKPASAKRQQLSAALIGTKQLVKWQLAGVQPRHQDFKLFEGGLIACGQRCERRRSWRGGTRLGGIRRS